MRNCRTCKYAEWERSKNGRVNPNRAGRCTWRKVIHVPDSYNAISHRRGEPVVLEGGYIWRKGSYSKCPAYQPADGILPK